MVRRTAALGARPVATYGSEGLGFESLQARKTRKSPSPARMRVGGSFASRTTGRLANTSANTGLGYEEGVRRASRQGRLPATHAEHPSRSPRGPIVPMTAPCQGVRVHGAGETVRQLHAPRMGISYWTNPLDCATRSYIARATAFASWVSQ